MILATDPEARRLLETVADIAFIAGAKDYHSGDSRQDIDLFIKGAFEFEKKRKVDEKGNETYDDEDYMTAIERFAYDLLELEPLWGQQPPATGNATPTLIGDGETQEEKTKSDNHTEIDKPPRKVARYTVIFERDIGDEDGQNDLGVTDDASAIEQLRWELQDAYDECGIAGRFGIAKREVIEIK